MTSGRDDFEIRRSPIDEVDGNYADLTLAELHYYIDSDERAPARAAKSKAELYRRQHRDRIELENVAERREVGRRKFEDGMQDRREAFALELEDRREAAQRETAAKQLQLAEEQHDTARSAARAARAAAAAAFGLLVIAILQFFRDVY